MRRWDVLRIVLTRPAAPSQCRVIQKGQSLDLPGKAMRCTSCGSENPASKRFCGDCGSPLGSRCARCGVENPAGKKFCVDCGAVLSQPTAAPRSAESATKPSPAVRIASEQPDSSTAADGERKTVTALFADIKGSMELIEDLDPEEARTIVDPALKLMRDAVHRYEGYVAQSTGDGIFALFGAPVAHEDHPQRDHITTHFELVSTPKSRK
jgi:hypothetical protein